MLVFLLGHPGAGKTSLYNHLSAIMVTHGHKVKRINDRDVFRKTLLCDPDHLYHRQNSDGSIDVTHCYFFDLLIVLLKDEIVSQIDNDSWLFVEMTSDNYLRTFTHIGHDLIGTSCLILVHSSVETSLRRNASRCLQSTDLDQTPIPDAYIHHCFDQDCLPLPSFFKYALHLDNDSDDIHQLLALSHTAIRFLEHITSD